MLRPVWWNEWVVWGVRLAWALSMAAQVLDVVSALARLVNLSSAHVKCQLSRASSPLLCWQWAWCLKTQQRALHLNVLGLGLGCLDVLLVCEWCYGRSAVNCGSIEYLLLRLV